MADPMRKFVNIVIGKLGTVIVSGKAKMTEGEPRIRGLAKQTAKNLWYFECTGEINGMEITVPLSTEDVGDIKKVHVGQMILEEIKIMEQAFRDDGRKLVSDIE